MRTLAFVTKKLEKNGYQVVDMNQSAAGGDKHYTAYGKQGKKIHFVGGETSGTGFFRVGIKSFPNIEQALKYSEKMFGTW